MPRSVKPSGRSFHLSNRRICPNNPRHPSPAAPSPHRPLAHPPTRSPYAKPLEPWPRLQALRSPRQKPMHDPRSCATLPPCQCPVPARTAAAAHSSAAPPLTPSCSPADASTSRVSKFMHVAIVATSCPLQKDRTNYNAVSKSSSGCSTTLKDRCVILSNG